MAVLREKARPQFGQMQSIAKLAVVSEWHGNRLIERVAIVNRKLIKKER